jgi:hypothetical protein
MSHGASMMSSWLSKVANNQSNPLMGVITNSAAREAELQSVKHPKDEALSLIFADEFKEIAEMPTAFIVDPYESESELNEEVDEDDSSDKDEMNEAEGVAESPDDRVSAAGNVESDSDFDMLMGEETLEELEGYDYPDEVDSDLKLENCSAVGDERIDLTANHASNINPDQ